MCASNVTCARLSKFRLNHNITQYFNPIWARSCHLSLLFLLSLRGPRRSSDLSSSVHSTGLPNNSSRPPVSQFRSRHRSIFAWDSRSLSRILAWIRGLYLFVLALRSESNQVD